MSFKIDRGVPLPNAWPGFVRTMRRLDYGDSFLVEDPGLCTPSTIYSLARREGIRVSVRQVAGGIRIWRIEDRQHMNTSCVKRSPKDLNYRMRKAEANHAATA